VSDERLHAGRDIVRGLQARFDTKIVREGSYLFADLGDVSGDDEQAAIDAGVIQATGIRYVGRLRAPDPRDRRRGRLAGADQSASKATDNEA
jgi:hypothetical protein